jgi:hypothetical protein
MISTLISHIEESLALANNNKSKISDDLLKMEGMSGKKTRHFYNNLCSMNNTRYLEIGTWKGSSLCSAMFNNKITCVAIDNFSEFDGPRDDFIKNLDKYKGINNVTFIEKNCWDIDVSKLGKFDIYMYDGNHNHDSHYKALNHYLPCLDDIFIYIIDDWNWPWVRDPTLKAILDNNLEIIYKKEIFVEHDENYVTPLSGPDSDWHNGISIFILKKN